MLFIFISIHLFIYLPPLHQCVQPRSDKDHESSQDKSHIPFTTEQYHTQTETYCLAHSQHQVRWYRTHSLQVNISLIFEKSYFKHKHKKKRLTDASWFTPETQTSCDVKLIVNSMYELNRPSYDDLITRCPLIISLHKKRKRGRDKRC